MFLVGRIRKGLVGPHVRQQVSRFVRLFAFTLVSQIVALGAVHVGSKALLSVAVGAAEVSWRSLAPVVPRGRHAAVAAGLAADGSGDSA